MPYNKKEFAALSLTLALPLESEFSMVRHKNVRDLFAPASLMREIHLFLTCKVALRYSSIDDRVHQGGEDGMQNCCRSVGDPARSWFCKQRGNYHLGLDREGKVRRRGCLVLDASCSRDTNLGGALQ